MGKNYARCKVCYGQANHFNPCDPNLARPGWRRGAVATKTKRKLKEARSDERLVLRPEERKRTSGAVRSFDPIFKHHSDEGKKRTTKRRDR